MNYPTVVTLKGPDRVRKRPSVIFGSDTVEGAAEAIKQLLNIFIGEAALGLSDGINVTAHKDNSISIHSLDRGFVLDETVIEGKPVWYWDFCELYPDFVCSGERDYYTPFDNCSSYREDETPSKEYQIDIPCSFDLCCVQYVSKYMQVKSTRQGERKSLNFEKGYSVSALQKESCPDRSSTFIKLLLDADVFEEVNVPKNHIAAFLREAAITIPGLKCSFKDERDETEMTYHYPGGLLDFADEIAAHPTPFFVNEINATGKDRYNRREYTAKARILVCFVPDSGQTICFHNQRSLKLGGCHLDDIKEKLLRYMNWEFASDLREKHKVSGIMAELSFDSISKNILLIIQTNCDEIASNYQNATKNALTNRMIADMCSDLISQDFCDYLKQNRESILDILKG